LFSIPLHGKNRSTSFVLTCSEGPLGSLYDFYYEIDELDDYPKQTIIQNSPIKEVAYTFSLNNYMFRLPKLKLKVMCDVNSRLGTSSGSANIYLYVKLDNEIEQLSESLIYLDLSVKLSDTEFNKRSKLINSLAQTIQNDYNLAEDQDLFRNITKVVPVKKSKII